MAHAEHGQELGHIVPLKTYRNILITLLILTVLTVAVSRVDFGAWNIVIAMIIASVKAVLVALVFMHLKYENPLLWAYAILPLILLFLLLGGVFIDNPYRHPTGPGSDAKAAAPAHEAPAHH